MNTWSKVKKLMKTHNINRIPLTIRTDIDSIMELDLLSETEVKTMLSRGQDILDGKS